MGTTHDTSAATGSAPARPPAPPAPDYAVAQIPARGIFVGLIIFALVASTIAMVAFIWYRWAGVREPTTAVIIQGDASLDGTLITVSGPDRVVTASLESSNGYSVPILVDPGIYTVRAEHPDGRLLLNKDVEVRRFFGVIFDLTEYLRQLPPGGLPAPFPGDDAATPASGPSARAPFPDIP